jgi:hypothetical protein
MRSRACCCLSHPTALITGSVLLALVLAMLAGCQGLPGNVANCSVMPTPPTNTSVVPPATEPQPAALCAFPLTIATGRNSASVHSPPHLSERRGAGSDYTVRIYVDGAAVFTRRPRRSINTSGCEWTTYRGNGGGGCRRVYRHVFHSVECSGRRRGRHRHPEQNELGFVLRAHFWLDLRGPCGRSAVQLGSPSIRPITGSIGFQVQPGRKTSLLE